MSPLGNGPHGHWHMTRDIKPRGVCGGCDEEYWQAEDERKDQNLQAEAKS